ncbi:hypothetical protein V6N11_002007 [Hibiscus sabdariffa]|uniref:Uncharacterized protein n=1 Tax=Hibiscus sabdariffa TaxID=183260 RepID=A0ABR2QU34_9ROSI
MPELPEDSRLPKKQRCRVEAPLDITSTDIPATMDCDNPILAAPGMNPPSYKDMLTGGSVNDPDDDLISLDEDDIELLDEDVRIGEMDGIPFIDFSDCGLPITWYKRSLIAAIGERIGQVVKIDYQKDYGRCGRFAHMAIKRDEDNIPHKVSQDKPKPKQPESFGPWMLVDRKQQRQPRKPIAVDTKDTSFPLQQSRYNPIFMDNDNTEAMTTQADLVTIPIREQAHDTVAPLATDQSNVHIHTTHSNTSLVKLKAKGKLPQAVRKPTTLNLGSKSVNILTRKLEIDPSAAPMALVGNSLCKPNINKNSTVNLHLAIAIDVCLLPNESLPNHGLTESPVALT